MINYWLQVDNVTKDGLLNTLSLCRDLKAPLSEALLPLTASSLSILPLRSSTHTATEWKGVPAVCFYHSICLLKAAFTYMRRTTAAPARRLTPNTLTCSETLWVQCEPPSASKSSANMHLRMHVAWLIALVEEKTRLHPSHVVQENSLQTCRQIAYKPPLGRMKTCDQKCVVVPDVFEHCAGFAPQEMHLDPKSHGGCGIPKNSPSGVWNLPPSCKHKPPVCVGWMVYYETMM